jgi:hypothetical protein
MEEPAAPAAQADTAAELDIALRDRVALPAIQALTE